MDPSYVNLLTAAKHFNVSSATVRIWIGKGAPHQKLEKTHGGIGAHYFVNLDELKNWLQERRAVGAGIGRLALQDFVPIVELKTLLQKLRTNLGWTKKQIAEELKISMSKLNTYLFPELYDLKNGPKYLISKIEYLLLYGAKKQHPLSLPSKQQVVEALQESSGIQKYAAEHLNIAASTLDKLIVKYALEDHLKKSADQRYTVKQLKRVIKKTHGNIREASEILGLGRDALNELLKKAKLQQILQRYRSAPRRKLLRDIKDGLKLHQGNLRAVGEMLGLPTKTITNYVERNKSLKRLAIRLRRIKLRRKITIVKAAMILANGDLQQTAQLLNIKYNLLHSFVFRHHRFLADFARELRAQALADKINIIQTILHDNGNNIKAAAKELGMNVETLRSFLRVHGLLNFH